jgi:spore coat protein H
MVSDIRFVVLFINDECRGLYCLIERVDECFFRNRGEAVGTFYDAYSGLADFTFKGGYDVRVGFEKKPVDDGNYSDLEHLIHVLDNTPANEFMREVENVLDVNSYLAYLAVSTLISNVDGFFKNFYLYSPEHRRFQIIPWDLDNTFLPGKSDYTLYGENSLSKRLMEVEEYRVRYEALLSSLLENEFSGEKVFAIIDSLSDHVKDAYSADPVLKAKGLDIDGEAQVIKDFVQDRSAFIKKHLGILSGMECSNPSQ